MFLKTIDTIRVTQSQQGNFISNNLITIRVWLTSANPIKIII
ncbi:hypothetical protein VCRA2110O318_30205 [Vibrio crassostreae]|nr:hypothetical protein VCRA2110O318_30205 [Vibrio crassostreae]CAK2947646.1 hypothetical protein VCRA217O317_50043 [Vibrio crassostreae]CAK3258382.1 hypothetical protein VCRA2122O11_190022 [Vibrio crassostreae]CAK3401682.1 hypothetical protein VCRA2126E14_200076 [Vibrio crassostreae]CAK3442785.1 hypothetical protein VCRA2123O13_210078 [Vibrio crassostreae]